MAIVVLNIWFARIYLQRSLVVAGLNICNAKDCNRTVVQSIPVLEIAETVQSSLLLLSVVVASSVQK